MVIHTGGGSFHFHQWGRSFKTTSPPVVEGEIQLIQQKEIQSFYSENCRLNILAMDQFHSDVVLDGDNNGTADGGRGDAIYTTDGNNGVMVRTADCMPWFVFSDTPLILFGVHAGWKGLDLNIARNVFEKVSENGVSLQNIKLIIGPYHRERYEVREDVYGRFPLQFSTPGINQGTRYLDMGQVLFGQISSSGIAADQIIELDLDTSHSELLYSHRAGDRYRNFSVMFYRKNGVLVQG